MTKSKSMKLRAYECQLEQDGPAVVVNHISAKGARWDCFVRATDSLPGLKITDIRCRLLGQPAESESFRRAAKLMGVEFARIGMAVEVEGVPGIIASENLSDTFNVVFTAGQNKGETRTCHPRWKMRYFDAQGRQITS